MTDDELLELVRGAPHGHGWLVAALRAVEQRTIERCAAEAERTYIKSATLFELGTAAADAIRALGAK